MGSVEQAQITGFLCRLCSKMHRIVVHIYGHEGIKHKLEQKINNYLPVTVTPTDLLPKTICKQCMNRVEQHHKLMETIAANHIKFQKLQNASAEVRRNIITRRRNLLSSANNALSPSTSNQSTSTESVPMTAMNNEPTSTQDDSSSTSSSNTDSITTSINTNDLSLATNNDSTIHDDDESLIESANSE